MAEQWVLYFYQGELGESHEAPNAFSIPRLAGSPPLSLRELLAYFPSPHVHSLIFRFRVPDDEHGYVWEDVSNDVDPLPRMRNGEIFMKVLRIDEESMVKRKLFLKRKLKSKAASHENFSKNESAPRMNAPSQRRETAHVTPPKDPPRKPEKPLSKAPTPVRDEPSILEFEASSSDVGVAPARPSEEDLVDFGDFVQNQGQHSASLSPDIEAMSLNRDDLARHREDDVRQKVEAALHFKLEVWRRLQL